MITIQFENFNILNALVTIFGPGAAAKGLNVIAKTEAATAIIAQTTAFADKTLTAIELLATGTTRARGIPAGNIYKTLKAWNENGQIMVKSLRSSS